MGWEGFEDGGSENAQFKGNLFKVVTGCIDSGRISVSASHPYFKGV